MIGQRSVREKVILTLAGSLALAFGFVEYIGEPLYLKQKAQERKIESKILFITKYHQYLNQKVYYREKEQASKKLSEQLSELFLSPSQPALAAAGLQKMLEDKAKHSNVHLVQVKTEKSQVLNSMISIPVRITVKSSLEKLSRFIKSIESDQNFLVVKELVIRRRNKKEPEQLESHLTVSGFIQQEPKGKPRQT